MGEFEDMLERLNGKPGTSKSPAPVSIGVTPVATAPSGGFDDMLSRFNTGMQGAAPVKATASDSFEGMLGKFNAGIRAVSAPVLDSSVEQVMESLKPPPEVQGINPLMHPKEFVERWAPVEHIKKMWEDDKVKGPMKGLHMIGAPMQTVARGITNLFGAPEEDFAKPLMAARKYDVNPNAPVPTSPFDIVGIAKSIYHEPGTWARGVLGETLTMASDPLVYMSFGGSKAWEAAEKIAKRVPEIASLQAPAKFLEAGLPVAAKDVRMVADITPATLRESIVPAMVKDNLKQVYPPGSLSTPKAQSFSEVIMESYGDKSSSLFKDALEKARKDPKVRGDKYTTNVPGSITDGSLPIQKRVEDLANHHAALEKDIWANRPGTRMFGARIGPSPFDVAGKILQRPLGKWTPNSAMSMSIDEAPAAAKANFQNALPLFGDVSRVTLPSGGKQVFSGTSKVGEVTDSLQYLQTGEYHLGGILTGTHPNDMTSDNPLFNWVKGTLEAFGANDRTKVLGQIKSMYSGLHEVLKANPRTITQVEIGGVENAIKQLDHWEGAGIQKFWNAIDPAVNPFTPLEKRFNALQDEGTRLNGIFATGKTDFESALATLKATDNPNNLVDLLYKNLEIKASVPVNDIVKWAKSYHEFNLSKVPYTAAAENLVRNKSIIRMAEDSIDISNNLNKSIGVEMKPFMYRMEILKGVNKDALEASMANVKLGVVTPADVLAVKQMFHDELSAMKNLAPAEHTAQADFINSLTGDRPVKLALVLTDLKEAVAHQSAYGMLMQRFQVPLSEMANQGSIIAHQVHGKEMELLSQQWQYNQAVYDFSSETGKNLWNNWFAPAIDKYLATWCKYAGVSPMLAEKLEENNSLKQLAHNKGLDAGTLFAVGDLPSKAGQAGFQKGLAGMLEQYKKRISQSELCAVDTGVTKIVGYERGLLRPGTKPKDVEIRNIATQRIAEGRAQIAAVVGPGNVDALVTEARTEVQRIMDLRYDIDRKAGAGIMYREGYIPSVLVGSRNDKHLFYDDARMANVHTVRQMAGSSESYTNIMTHKMQAEHARHFDNMAEFEHALNAFKAKNVGKNLNLELEHSMAGIVGDRVASSEKMLAARKMIANLKQVLPGHVIPIMDKVDKAYMGYLKAHDWVDLGQMVPWMHGWMSSQELAMYLKKNSNAFFNEREAATEMLDIIGGFNLRSGKMLMRFSPFHMKNIASNALVAGMDWSLMANNIKFIAEHGRNRVGNTKDRMLTFLSPYKDALHEHPLWELADRSGAFPGMGHESRISVSEAIKNRISPVSLKGYYKSSEGPFSTLTFDIFDNACRMTLFEQFLKKGVTPIEAARFTNLYLIDYALKSMPYETRRLGYAIFPFFAWTYGNHVVHIPDMVMHPRWYAITAKSLEMQEQNTSGMTKIPESLYGTILTNMKIPGHEPGSMYGTALRVSLPYLKMRRVAGKIYDQLFSEPITPKSATLVGKEVVKHFANEALDIPWRVLRGLDRPPSREKDPSWSEYIMGGSDPGLLQKYLWTIAPYMNAYDHITSGDMIRNGKLDPERVATDLGIDLTSLFLPVQKIGPNGLPYYGR